LARVLLVLAERPVSSPEQILAFEGAEPRHEYTTGSVHTPPTFVYGLLQVYSHFAAEQLLVTVLDVLAERPVLSPEHNVAFEGVAPVQEQAAGALALMFADGLPAPAVFHDWRLYEWKEPSLRPLCG
jgi:hypothetical protein